MGQAFEQSWPRCYLRLKREGISHARQRPSHSGCIENKSSGDASCNVLCMGQAFEQSWHKRMAFEPETRLWMEPQPHHQRRSFGWYWCDTREMELWPWKCTNWSMDACRWDLGWL